MARGFGGGCCQLALHILVCKISKIIYFILLFWFWDIALPRPETYLDYEISQEIYLPLLIRLLNADTMYDTFFYISLIAR